MQNHLHHAYAQARVQAAVAEGARRHVADEWEPKGRRPVVVEWEKPATVRRLFDRVSYSETYLQNPATGQAG